MPLQALACASPPHPGNPPANAGPGAPATASHPAAWDQRPADGDADAVVIGAGVVGLAIARALAAAGREVLVLEAESAFGTGVSSRNSEVIHAGIYYPPGSARARLCVRGKALLYDFCERHGVAHQRCGKLIVATAADEAAALDRIAANARDSGVLDLQRLSAAQARTLEPALQCTEALLSPSTGIVDSHGLMLALLGEAERHGAALALQSPVEALQAIGSGSPSPGHRLRLAVGGAEPMVLAARTVVNAAGLGAPVLGRATGGLAASAPAAPVGRWAKGSYFTLTGRSPFSRLIYPAPGDSGHLGVHLTLDLGGQAKFGPGFEWVDRLDYTVRPEEAEGFYGAVRRYWPDLPDGALQAGYAGIRPKISAPGEPAADFRIDGPQSLGVPGLVQLYGIESPGLTASLAIAEAVSALPGLTA